MFLCFCLVVMYVIFKNFLVFLDLLLVFGYDYFENFMELVGFHKSKLEVCLKFQANFKQTSIFKLNSKTNQKNFFKHFPNKIIAKKFNQTKNRHTHTHRKCMVRGLGVGL